MGSSQIEARVPHLWLIVSPGKTWQNLATPDHTCPPLDPRALSRYALTSPKTTSEP